MKAIIATAWLLLYCGTAHAISDLEAYKCLAGEVRGASKATIRATAHALRSRGTTQGVFGCEAEILAPEIAYMQRKGIDLYIVWAWHATLRTADPTHGATHWENVEDFGHPDWDGAFYLIAIIGEHYFYVELKERTK